MIFGMKVLTNCMVPDDTVIIMKDGKHLEKFILTANLLADQEIEIAKLKAKLAMARARIHSDICSKNCVQECIEISAIVGKP